MTLKISTPEEVHYSQSVKHVAGMNKIDEMIAN